MPGSVANVDFVADLADASTVVLKTGPATEIAAEAWVCRRLAARGFPVPRLVAADVHGAALGRPYLVLDFVEGAASEEPRVAYEAGGWCRRLHTDELPGWGPLVPDTDTSAHGRYDSPRRAVTAELAVVPELVAAGVLDRSLADAATALVRVDVVLEPAQPGVLLHHDLKPAHLFGRSDGGRIRLSAVIDWGDARVGDPLADLARLSMSAPSVTAAFLDGYGLEPTAEAMDTLARQRLLWNLSALGYEHRAGGDWFDVYRDRVRDDVDRLTS
ncbi:MAG TPA: aminoglycoside phosphotransferase family protein [Microlunatus sp.]|nr:aminoglycoside phosphotransferase family protein [Microlunatus sp.]